MFDTIDVGLITSLNDGTGAPAGMEITSHIPVSPAPVLLPANVADEAHMVWSEPAVEVVTTGAEIVIATIDELLAHAPFEMVQLKK